jgi:hypothetical protein
MNGNVLPLNLAVYIHTPFCKVRLRIPQRVAEGAPSATQEFRDTPRYLMEAL